MAERYQMILPNKPFDGPIPGENYLSDTKNYPWHRPPEYTTKDEAIDHIVSVLKKPKSVFAVVQMMEMGLSVADVTGVLLMKGISKGKWSIDLALMLAGPVAHILVILAKKAEINYELGLSDQYDGPTKAYFKAVEKDQFSGELDKDTEKEIDEVKTKSSGFLPEDFGTKGKVE